MNHLGNFSFVLATAGILAGGCQQKDRATVINIYPDSVLADVSHHPVGINVDYFMDDDNYLKPARRTADALKDMGVRYIRYPGGNKSDLYLFSVSPWEKSIPTLSRTGKGAVEDYYRILKDYRGYKNDVLDFDEFIAMCREVGAEPVVTVAADEYLAAYPEGCTWTDREGLIRNAVEWVRYSNIKKDYGVRYWMIGNECYHRNNPNSTAEIYARDVLDFSKAMKAIDPSISIIPNGNSVSFFKEILTTAAGHIDYLCVSNYPVWQYDAGYYSYRDTLQDLMGPVKRALTAIDSFAAPGDKEKLKVIASEFGPFDWSYIWPMVNDMGHTLCNFEMAGEQLINPRVEFSCYWNTRWINNDSLENHIDDALDKNGNFNAVGYGMAIWGNFLGDLMVRTTSTLHLRTFASFVPETKRLYVYLMNMIEEPQTVSLRLENNEIGSVLQAWELFGNGPDDVNPVWQQTDRFVDADDFTVKGTSITVIEFKLE